MEDKSTMVKDSDCICLICGEPVPMSKNHREPVYIKGSRYCEDVCFDCIYKGGKYFTQNLHKGFYHCPDCGDISEGDKCLGECMQMELAGQKSLLGKRVRSMLLTGPGQVVGEDSAEVFGEGRGILKVKDSNGNISEIWRDSVYYFE